MRRTGAKNFDASNEEASTKVSRAVRALQDKLPLSRVIYASATGVSEIKNMAYAERLGLWGAGTSFADFKTFADTLEKRGVDLTKSEVERMVRKFGAKKEGGDDFDDDLDDLDFDDEDGYTQHCEERDA